MAENAIRTDNGGLENLMAPRMSLEKSRDLAMALQKTGSRLEGMSNRLPALEAAVHPMRTHRNVLFGIDRAVSPAAAVLRVFDAVHGLKKSLLCNPRSDIWGYLSLVEVLKFLAENCSVATQWLEYLEENSVADAEPQRLFGKPEGPAIPRGSNPPGRWSHGSSRPNSEGFWWSTAAVHSPTSVVDRLQLR